VGSLNIDYVYHVEHLVKLGETIHSIGFERHLGGKGLNQSVALAKAGADTYHAGEIGSDGIDLRDTLYKSGVNIDYIEMVNDIPSGHAIIQVDKNGQNCIIIVNSGANSAVTKDYINKVISNFSRGDIIIMQNEISNVSYAIKYAKHHGMKVALNPSPINEDLIHSEALENVDWFIMNEVEGYGLTQKQEPTEICKEMLNRYPCCNVVLTLGKIGVMHFDGKKFETHGIYNVPVVDTTAAGDTFAGYYIAMISKGCSIRSALLYASKASSLTVSKSGASNSIPTFEDDPHPKNMVHSEY
jgi:ribokinase